VETKPRGARDPGGGPRVSLSVVSHGQGALVADLLRDLQTHVAGPIEVILTLNIAEDLPFSPRDFAFPVRLIANDWPKGFGANHNQAFSVASGEYFAVLNPDIRLHDDPLPALIEVLAADVGVVAPAVRNPGNEAEDSARRFPTLLEIMRKAVFGRRGTDYPAGAPVIFPDWVAGMFMLFPRRVFADCKGFDERYFLYYEDVDLCARLRRAGLRACQVQGCEVIHDARRQSHRSLRYLRWHLTSMLRFFLSHPRLALGLR
jgi:hypothetical protein